VIAAWDAIGRVWLVVSAWLAQRRPARLARLAAITDPGRFVRAVIAPAGRHVAIAIAFLPRRRRGEAGITLLIYRALRELDRRAAQATEPTAARDAVRATVAYLVGEAGAPGGRAGEVPWAAGSGVARRGDHADVRTAPQLAGIDALLAARLPLLRAALEALPGDAVRRCRAMIERVGDSLVRDRADRYDDTAYAHGETVIYAMRLAAPSVRPPDATCRAVGRALQVTSELERLRQLGTIDARSNVGRDATHGIVVTIEAEGSRPRPRRPGPPPPSRGAGPGDPGAVAPGVPSAMDAAGRAAARDRLLSRALAELSHVPRLARWLPGSVGPGTRAAAALLVATVCTRIRREIDPAALGACSPLRAALTAAWSRRGYLAAIDDAIRTAIEAHSPRHDEPLPAPASDPAGLALAFAVNPATADAGGPPSAGSPDPVVAATNRAPRRWRARLHL
jgi:hypothetical protein